MRYLARTLQVRAALLERPDLQDSIKNLFTAHSDKKGNYEFSDNGIVGIGTSRVAYTAGECELPGGEKISLLLKIYKNVDRREYRRLVTRERGSIIDEFGVTELYYEFIAGLIPTVRFVSAEKHAAYCAKGKPLPFEFSLSEQWGGTQVAQGDLGAIPYFQMVVRCDKWFGHLTEGEPPLVEPRFTVRDVGQEGLHESGRLIDLGVTQTQLGFIDWGGDPIGTREPCANNLGLRERGAKYFTKNHRLDL